MVLPCLDYERDAFGETEESSGGEEPSLRVETGRLFVILVCLRALARPKCRQFELRAGPLSRIERNHSSRAALGRLGDLLLGRSRSLLRR